MNSSPHSTNSHLHPLSHHQNFSGESLDFFLELGCSVLVFNYRGFGRSVGRTTSPYSVKQDAVALYLYLTRLGVAKIGVYGRSIGSTAACEIAGGSTTLGGTSLDRSKLQFCVVDRGMHSLRTLNKKSSLMDSTKLFCGGE